MAAGVRRLGSRVVGLASSASVLFVAAAIIEAAAVAMGVRLLVLGIRSGFL
jgi:hypothetical protein